MWVVDFKKHSEGDVAEQYYRADINADGHRIPEADRLKQEAINFVKGLRMRDIGEGDALAAIEKKFSTSGPSSKIGEIHVGPDNVKQQFLRDVALAANQALDSEGNFKTGSSKRFVENLHRVADGVASVTHGWPMWKRLQDAVENHGGKFGKIAIAGAGAAMSGLAAAAEPGHETETVWQGTKRVLGSVAAEYVPGAKDLMNGRTCRGAFTAAATLGGNALGAPVGVGVGLVTGAAVGAVTTALAAPTGPAAPIIGTGAGAVAGWAAGNETADRVSTVVENVGRKMSDMMCGR